MTYSLFYSGDMLKMIPALLSSGTSVLVSLAAYVLESLGLYIMAKYRGLRHPWLAWIPVLNCWILGSLSDQYRYVVRDEYRNRRRWLLALRLTQCVIGMIITGVVSAAAVHAVISGVFMNPYAYLGWLQPVMWVVALFIPMTAAAIAYRILFFMALYDVYRSCDPGTAAEYLVLSIFFPFLRPFFLFFHREKEKGMPPRKTE